MSGVKWQFFVCVHRRFEIINNEDANIALWSNKDFEVDVCAFPLHVGK